jgi:hypothetical protein
MNPHALYRYAVAIILFVPFYSNLFSQVPETQYHLIAHRGGVVDANTAENSRESITKAIARGYWMVEIDLRVTKDSVLIIHHDRNLKRYYNVDGLVDEMTWEEIRTASNGKVLKFEDALKICRNKIQVMIDNKIKGNDTTLWSKVILLLKKNGLYEKALTIGTDESTEYFTGKIKLSCTREQLQNNMKRTDYRPENYYLFSGIISEDDAAWAQKHKILTVGVLNKWALKDAPPEKIAAIAKGMKAAGITHFQIDSEYEYLFHSPAKDRLSN